MKADITQIVNLPSLQAAPKLLGWNICRKVPKGVIKVRIVETEAYHQHDPASHSFKGLTKRTAPMFEAGGMLYVYFTYGKHYCLNIVTGNKGVGEAVLLRAGEPLDGINLIKKYRRTDSLEQLANGPGKLAQALGIFDTSLSGTMLNKSSIYLEPPVTDIDSRMIDSSPRIGISKATVNPWRFYIKDNRFVSGRKTAYIP